jgi:hypothetical protein
MLRLIAFFGEQLSRQLDVLKSPRMVYLAFMDFSFEELLVEVWRQTVAPEKLRPSLESIRYVWAAPRRTLRSAA